MNQRVNRASSPGKKQRSRKPAARNEAEVSPPTEVKWSQRDIRVAMDLPNHPKTKRLLRLLGPSGPWHLIKLWCWAGSSATSGLLAGKSDDDIELAVDWPGEPGEFIAALVKVRFLDGHEFARELHDWRDHNAWIASHRDRSEKSQFAAICKHHSRAYAEAAMPEYAAKLRARSPNLEDFEGDRNPASGMPVAESGNAPSPVPVPVPVPVTSSPTLEVTVTHSARITAQAERACALMRKAGLIGVSTQHPDLLEAIAMGVQPEAIRDCAAEAIRKRKSNPLGWAISAARGRHADRDQATPSTGDTDATDRRRPGESLADYAARRNRTHDDADALRA